MTARPQRSGLGTFGGVFTPSILTILGVIMYLRLGWVVGNVGLVGTLVIVTICTSITFLTALSMASIATDRRVGVGGAYYMISRSLGVETGGAVGIPLYFAVALSTALYTIGFAESLVSVFPALNLRWTGLITTVLIATLAIKSARLAIRAQYVVMAIIAISLLSLVLGSPIEGATADLTGTPTLGTESFWVVLAVFFPAVTGIEAGVNMSGDLKNPARSIPLGTLAALATGYLVYMGLPVVLSQRAAPEALVADPLVMRRMALWGEVVLLGVWGATLSSAMGSILGAPRILQALARDRILPRPLRFLGRGSGEEDTPRLGTALTLGVVLVAVWFGDLNAVAPILTMFFLTSYLTVNLAAGFEGMLGSPSFRPAFRVPWALSLVGSGLCLSVMFLINAPATILAAVIVLLVYLWLQRRGLEGTWGDVRSGLWLAIVRSGLLRVTDEVDMKTWRPHPVVLSGAPTQRWPLIELADDLTHGRGLVTVCSVLDPSTSPRRRRALEGTVRDYLSERGVDAFVRLVAAPDTFEGAVRLVDIYGFGRLVPNTVILGDSERVEARNQYCSMISSFHESGRNVLILRDPEELGFREKSRIDVWWGGLESNGGLMLILSHLLRSGLAWRRAQIRLKLVVSNAASVAPTRENLESLVASLRIPGAVAEVIAAEGRLFESILRERSKGADVTLMGMARPDDEFAAYYSGLQAKASGLPPTVFVLAAPRLDFGEVLLEHEV